MTFPRPLEFRSTYFRGPWNSFQNFTTFLWRQATLGGFVAFKRPLNSSLPLLYFCRHNNCYKICLQFPIFAILSETKNCNRPGKRFYSICLYNLWLREPILWANIWTVSLTACGSMLTGSSGRFASPNFPRSYANGMDCEWTIQVPPGKIINLKFLFFDVEGKSMFSSEYYSRNSLKILWTERIAIKSKYLNLGGNYNAIMLAAGKMKRWFTFELQ